MENPNLDNNEIKRALGCIANIEDKIKAIKQELLKEKPYKYYINEKIDSVLWDAKCIKSMSKEKDI